MESLSCHSIKFLSDWDNEKKDNKQCLLDTPRRVPVIKDSYQNTKCQ